jgi:hypothetical protein
VFPGRVKGSCRVLKIESDELRVWGAA